MRDELAGGGVREFSMVWKKVFHGVEKMGVSFPRCGKKWSEFSTVWKIYFHGVEN